MSTFIEHRPCPICGSRDNLAIYTDHEWCFGCGYLKTYGIKKTYNHHKQEVTSPGVVLLPEDVSTAYPILAEEWIKKYNLTINSLYKHGVLWSEQRKLLIFPIYDDSEVVWGWQGRYFGDDPTHKKWTSKGDYKKLIKIFNLPKAQEHGIILVEDIISTIRLSTNYSVNCLYGSYIDIPKIISIYKLYKPNNIIIWLDYDKRKEANEYSLELNNLGIPTKVIVSHSDPKGYSDSEIKEFLK